MRFTADAGDPLFLAVILGVIAYACFRGGELDTPATGCLGLVFALLALLLFAFAVAGFVNPQPV